MPPSTASQTAFSLIPIIEGLQSPWLLQAFLLYALFTVHLIMANMVLGTATFSLVDRFLYAGDKYEQQAVRSCSILLPKGMAFVINFAIPPLLFLQGIYGQFIYSSSIIMGVWWLSIMGIAIFAYYGLYIHMAPQTISSSSRTGALALSVVLLSVVAFLLVNNVTLMYAPERWVVYAENPHGTFLNVAQAQVIPRFLHMVTASMAVGGLTIGLVAHYRIRQWADDPKAAPLVATAMLRRKRGLAWFFYATLCQLIIGPWFLLSLPHGRTFLFLGGDPVATAVFVIALTTGGITLYQARKGRIKVVTGLVVGVIFLMSFMRSRLRTSLLEPYYDPVMRPFEAGPPLFFAGCLLGSAILLVWMVKVYLKRQRLDESVVMLDALAETEGEVALVNEIHSLSADDDDDNGAQMPRDRS